jgi:Caspase domain/Tetratricopeptide repeat
MSIDKGPKSAFSYQNRGTSKQALGDIDGALADINEAIRIDPALPQPLTNRAVIWRAKGDFDRAIADVTEAIRLAKAKAPVNIITPPGSVLISAYAERGLAYEAKGDYANAKQDYAATLQGVASDTGSKANQATARVRLSLLSEAETPRTAPTSTSAPTKTLAPSPASPPAGAATGRRVALVIGNGAYTHVKALPNPSNDARAVAKSLRGISFVVTEGIDLDRSGMQNLIREFLRDAARSQVAIVYYAGHGVQIDGAAQAGRKPDRHHDGHGYHHGRARRPAAHQHPDPRCLPQQSDGAAGGVRRRGPRDRRRRPRRTFLARVRLDARRRHPDCVCDCARQGRARRRRRQQPVLGGAVASHRHAWPGSAADAHPGARRSRRCDQEPARAVVEFFAAR